MVAPKPMRPCDDSYEHAHGLEPIEDIHAERDRIAPRYTELRPLFGPAKLWEHRRKALLSLIAMELRQEWETKYKGVKQTVDAVSDAAHNDPRYRRAIDEAVALATEYEQLAIQMGNLEERANRSQAIAKLRASEMHMQPSGA